MLTVSVISPSPPTSYKHGSNPSAEEYIYIYTHTPTHPLPGNDSLLLHMPHTTTGFAVLEMVHASLPETVLHNFPQMIPEMFAVLSCSQGQCS